MNLHGFKKMYKPGNINVVFSSVDHNDMAVHLTRNFKNAMRWMGLICCGSECEEDEGTDCDNGGSDNDWKR